MGGTKTVVIFIFAAMLAAVFPLAPAGAAESESPVTVALEDQPECQWLLTRLIDLDRCAQGPRDRLAQLTLATSPDLGTSDISPCSRHYRGSSRRPQRPTPSTLTNPPLSPPKTSETACPEFTIDQVLADPSGDWDGDTFSNVREFYNGLNPCTFDEPEAEPAAPAVTAAPTIVSQTPAEGSLDVVSEAETGDEGAADDADTEPSAEEVAIADPECPVFTIAEVYANPNGDWDNDRASNLDEFNSNRNPCVFDEDASPTIASAETIEAGGPCPDYSLALVLEDPTGDWDRDRASNVDEFYSNSNPCVFDSAGTQNCGWRSASIGAMPKLLACVGTRRPDG